MIATGIDDRALRGAALAVRAAERELRRDIGRVTQSVARPLWRAELDRATRTAQDRRVYAGGQVTRGNPPELVTAQSGRRLRGGLTPGTDWPWVEFGSSGAHGQRGQLPPRNPAGRIAFAALPRVAPRVVSAWVGVVYGAYAGELGSE